MIMKKIMAVIAAAIMMAAMPVCANAYMLNIDCANGSYAVQTVSPDYFKNGDNIIHTEDADAEWEDYCAMMTEIVCREHGSEPA